MDKNEIIIGRQVEKGDYKIEEQYKMVGRRHARLFRKPDGVYIEDLDSANGTFVNGKSVKLKRITNADKIMLGGANYYELNLEKVLKMMPMSDKDFHEAFLRLKKIYEHYQTESGNLQTKGQTEMMTKRMLPTMLVGSLTAIASALGGGAAVAIIGGVLTVVVFLIASKMASESAKKMREKTNQLNENFELDYVCPACGISFRGKSWEFLKRDGKCPACKRTFQ